MANNDIKFDSGFDVQIGWKNFVFRTKTLFKAPWKRKDTEEITRLNQQVTDRDKMIEDLQRKLSDARSDLDMYMYKQHEQTNAYKSSVNYENVIDYIARHQDEESHVVRMSMLEALVPYEFYDIVRRDIDNHLQRNETVITNVDVHDGGFYVNQAEKVNS